MTGSRSLEVADIFRQHGPAYRLSNAATMFPAERRVMLAIERCRTAALGGHVEECDSCGNLRISYNSCRNRHCPKCQSLERARWLEARMADLLPVPYFHVVFTVPDRIAGVALQNRKVVYGVLFDATAETLRRIAADPKHLGAEIGFLAVLHTWGQTLEHHPHLHCVVPGGGLSPDRTRWIACRPHFFLSVRVLSKLFRRRFLDRLQKSFDRGDLAFHGTIGHLSGRPAFETLIAELRRVPWVVYAKRPFGGPAQVLEYLGRYTHRVAISNNRISGIDGGRVRFTYRDYRNGNGQRVMDLEADEFIRRFLLHVLPQGFHRIRQYGLLSNRRRSGDLATCRELLGAPMLHEPASQERDAKTSCKRVTGVDLDRCPACDTGQMRVVQVIARPTRSWMTHTRTIEAPTMNSS